MKVFIKNDCISDAIVVEGELGTYYIRVCEYYMYLRHLAELEADSDRLEWRFYYAIKKWQRAIITKHGIASLDTVPPIAWDERDWDTVDKMRLLLKEGVEV